MTEIIGEISATSGRMEGSATTKLTTTATTIMTARELKAAIKYNACLATMVMFQARHWVKDNIRARGDKISHYSAREITELAEDYLAQPGRREAIVECVKPWIEDFLFKKR
jgi:hypothetical protein